MKFVDEIKMKKIKSPKPKNVRFDMVNEETLHNQLGHPSNKLTIATAKSLNFKLKKKKTKCLSCMIAKAKKKSISKENKIDRPYPVNGFTSI